MDPTDADLMLLLGIALVVAGVALLDVFGWIRRRMRKPKPTIRVTLSGPYRIQRGAKPVHPWHPGLGETRKRQEIPRINGAQTDHQTVIGRKRGRK